MSKPTAEGTLFPVKGHLAERYAAALAHATGARCGLNAFSIDRMGWSPQLAAQLGDSYLGSDGMRYAIILSPDQGSAPLLRRRYSYESALIDMIYDEARATLLHVIEHEPLVAEFDNGQTFCRSAIDVFGIQQAVAHIETPQRTLAKTKELLDLAEGLKVQARLLDDSYIEQMLTLVRAVGDPRRRPLPPDVQLPVRSLWAEIDGVVYVLRPSSGRNGDTLVISTRATSALARLPLLSFEVDDPNLVDVLHQQGYLRFGNQEALLKKRLGELELEALLLANEENVPQNEVERRRRFNRSAAARAALPSLYWELSDEQKRLNAGASFDPAHLSPDARWALSTPGGDTEIMVNLLARFVRYDYRLMVHHQRRSIEAEWERYTPAKRAYLQLAFPALTQGFVAFEQVQ